MIDLSDFKEGDKLGTIYLVYEFGSGEVIRRKYEGCILTELSVRKYCLDYEVKDKDGKRVCSWAGSPPYWGTKVKEIFFSLDDACNAYKKILEKRVNELSKEIAECKKTVLYGLKDAFK